MREQKSITVLNPSKPNWFCLTAKVLVNHLKSRFNDNEINPDTATIAVYAEYGNEQNLLLPGNYVDIRIGKREKRLCHSSCSAGRFGSR